MTYFVSSGTKNLSSINKSTRKHRENEPESVGYSKTIGMTVETMCLRSRAVCRLLPTPAIAGDPTEKSTNDLNDIKGLLS